MPPVDSPTPASSEGPSAADPSAVVEALHAHIEYVLTAFAGAGLPWDAEAVVHAAAATAKAPRAAVRAGACPPPPPPSSAAPQPLPLSCEGDRGDLSPWRRRRRARAQCFTSSSRRIPTTLVRSNAPPISSTPYPLATMPGAVCRDCARRRRGGIHLGYVVRRRGRQPAGARVAAALSLRLVAP